jgi:hypothetical protein
MCNFSRKILIIMNIIIIMVIILRNLQCNSLGIRLQPKTMIIIYCSVGIAENVTQILLYLCTVCLTALSVVRKM